MNACGLDRVGSSFGADEHGNGSLNSTEYERQSLSQEGFLRIVGKLVTKQKYVYVYRTRN